jgi:hypothetical protein
MDKITYSSDRNVMQDGRDSDRLQYFIHALLIRFFKLGLFGSNWVTTFLIICIRIVANRTLSPVFIFL